MNYGILHETNCSAYRLFNKCNICFFFFCCCCFVLEIIVSHWRKPSATFFVSQHRCQSRASIKDENVIFWLFLCSHQHLMILRRTLNQIVNSYLFYFDPGWKWPFQACSETKISQADKKPGEPICPQQYQFILDSITRSESYSFNISQHGARNLMSSKAYCTILGFLTATSSC